MGGDLAAVLAINLHAEPHLPTSVTPHFRSVSIRYSCSRS
jgi:hypothetical protein